MDPASLTWNSVCEYRGGAIANDIHGKNHHLRGSFGDHILEFELFRSDGQLLKCSPSQNSELFYASLGDLG